MANSSVIHRCNDSYKRKINSNKDAIIEAFIEYYGEKYRDLITEKYNNIFFCWSFSDKTGEQYQKVCSCILEERLNITIQILKRLGFDSRFSLEVTCGSISLKNGEVLVNPGAIYNVYYVQNGYNVSMDGFLEMLFGKNRLFNFEYDSNPLYNFPFLSNEGKLDFVRKYFNQNEITTDILEKIQGAIDYMEEMKVYSSKLQKKEKSLIDLSLISSYLYGSKFNRFLNMVTDREIRIIGTTDKRLLSKYRKELEHHISEIQKDRLFACFSIPVNEKNTAIYMPYFFVDDYCFFHEINHSINNSVMAFIEEKRSLESINKNGLTVVPDMEFALFDELLNDRISSDVLDIFYGDNSKIFDYYRYSKNHSIYSYCFPLIEKFYQQFKDLIAEARITENRNILYSAIDKEKFKEYTSFVSSVSGKIIEQIMSQSSNNPEVSEEDVRKAEALVDAMALKDPKKIPTKKEQLEELRSYATNLRFLQDSELELIDERNNGKKVK